MRKIEYDNSWLVKANQMTRFPHARIAEPHDEEGSTMMPLTLAAVGEENRIKKVGGKPEVRKHLENLGFVAGRECDGVSVAGPEM